MNEVRFISAVGALGGGIPQDAFDEAMASLPHFIACDAGTTDAGPFSLGGGRPAFTREAVKHDLRVILAAGIQARIPVIVGSAGTAGGDSHVDWTLAIAKEVAAELKLTLRVAVIYSEQDKAYLKGLLRDDRLRPLDPAPPIDDATIDRSSRIVGMMGVEPLQEALKHGVDFILAGRCSDAALFAAFPIMRGFPEGLSWHAGKTVECGTLCCETVRKGVIFGWLRPDHFVVSPFGKDLRCTPQSIAAHSLYENTDPYLHKESSGTLDISRASYDKVDDRSVRVSGSAFARSDVFTVKLEGAEPTGYQSVIVGGIRDPLIIRQLDSWLDGVRAKAETAITRVLGDQVKKGDYHLVFHVYGRNAVMGALEPSADLPHEVGIVLEATAPTQELASKIAALCRQPLLHHPIPEWKGSITGFACLHNPAFVERGAVYKFNLHHVALPRMKEEMFRTQFITIGGAQT